MAKRKSATKRALTYPYFEIYGDSNGEWRWRIKARNGQTLGDSGEGYATHSNVEDAIARLNKVDWPLRVEESEAAAATVAGAGSSAVDPRNPSAQGAVRG